MESFVASVETFSQKKIKTPPSWISAKSENKKVIALDGMKMFKMFTKFQINWSNSLKVSRFQKSKMAAGLRLLSWISFITRKVHLIALFVQSWATNLERIGRAL
jgi:hypothetical protein